MDNSPHLAKHLFMSDGHAVVITLNDVLDYWDNAQFFEGDPTRGPAHWLMVCRIESAVVTIPLIPANSGDPTKCRPIGLFATTGADRLAYLEKEGQ